MDWGKVKDTATGSVSGIPGVGKSIGSTVSGGYKAAIGGVPGIKEQLGMSNDKGNELNAQLKQQGEDYWKNMSGLSDKMSGTGASYSSAMRGVGNAYLNSTNAAESGYRTSMSGLSNQARDQATNAQKVYDQNILPSALGIMDNARSEASQAMTLAQAQDPNNPVAGAFRQFYDTQAGNEGKSGLASVGVMQSLGAQATANQMGGMPMTGGQMQALMASNQSQAGQAMANVQRRQQDLRDQGTAQGWLQTQAAYDRGQQAKDRYSNSVGNLSSLQGANIGQQQGLRGEQGQYGTDILNSNNRQAGNAASVNSGQAGLDYQLGMGNLNRQAGIATGQFGMQSGMTQGDIQAQNAQQASRAQMLPGIMGGVGAGLGSIAGPGGAAVGQQMGTTMGGVTAQGSYAPASYGPGNYGYQQGGGYGGGQGQSSGIFNTLAQGQMNQGQSPYSWGGQGAATGAVQGYQPYGAAGSGGGIGNLMNGIS